MLLGMLSELSDVVAFPFGLLGLLFAMVPRSTARFIVFLLEKSTIE